MLIFEKGRLTVQVFLELWQQGFIRIFPSVKAKFQSPERVNAFIR